MTVTHEIVTGGIVCGFCGGTDTWRVLSFFADHLSHAHGAPRRAALSGEVRTPGWPEPATPTDTGPTPSVEDLPLPTDLLARMQQDREVRWDRELRLAAFNAAARTLPRWANNDTDGDRRMLATTLRLRADAIYRELSEWIGDGR